MQFLSLETHFPISISIDGERLGSFSITVTYMLLGCGKAVDVAQ